jgi:glycosyltransferase involved in cell wall biosynthesis
MIGRHEENLLPQTLGSLVGIADEIVFVDTGSRDGTVDAARQFNCQILHFPWCNDFSKPRNFGIEHARYEWILIIDCDEALFGAYARDQLDKVYSSLDQPAFLVWIDNLYEHRRVESFRAMRLFRNDPRIRFQRPIHESVCESVYQGWPDVAIETLDIRVKHYGYLSSCVAGKHERNANLLLGLIEHQPDDVYASYKLALTLHEVGNLDEALKYYARTFDLFSRSRDRNTYPFLDTFISVYGEALKKAGLIEHFRKFKKITDEWK